MRYFRNRKLPKYVHVVKGLVYVRFAKEKYRECFGRAEEAENVSKAIAQAAKLQTDRKSLARRESEEEARNIAFQEAVELFLSKHGPTWKYHLRTMARHFASLPLSSLNAVKLKDYKDARLSQGVNPASINREFTGLSSMLNHLQFLMDEGEIRPMALPPRSPVKIFRMKYKKDGWYNEKLNVRKRTLSPEEWLIFAEGATEKVRKACAASLNTALSKKDAFAVDRTAMADCGQLQGERSKTGRAFILASNDNIESLFAHGDRLDDTNFRREFEKSRKVFMEKGGKYFQFRDLRRTAARQVWDKTKDLVLCKELLSHASPETTMRYLGLTKADMQKAGQVLQEAFPVEGKTVGFKP